MTKIADQLSADLKALIKPLKTGETAVYRFIGGGAMLPEALHDGQVRPTAVIPPTVSLDAKTTIVDPYSNTELHIVAAAGQRPRTVMGGTIMEPVEVDITFKEGILAVRHNQIELYHFLELHPHNKDCVVPGNRPTSSYVFERLQEAKSQQAQARATELSIQAQAELMSYSYDELQRAAQRLKVDATGSRDALFTILVAKAQSEPERVWEAIGDRALKVESLVADALSLGVLEWVGEERVFVLKDSRARFLAVPHGNQDDELTVELMEPRFQSQRRMLEKLVAQAQQKPAKKK